MAQGSLQKHTPLKLLFVFLAVLFGVFLLLPMVMILLQSLGGGQGVSMQNYWEIFESKNFGSAFFNSVCLSAATGIITTLLAFLLAYTIHYTNLPKGFKKLIRLLAVLPMLLPTITYGFAIIYSFGKQGLLTMLFWPSAV